MPAGGRPWAGAPGSCELPWLSLCAPKPQQRPWAVSARCRRRQRAPGPALECAGGKQSLPQSLKHGSPVPVPLYTSGVTAGPPGLFRASCQRCSRGTTRASVGEVHALEGRKSPWDTEGGAGQGARPPCGAGTKGGFSEDCWAHCSSWEHFWVLCRAHLMQGALEVESG